MLKVPMCVELILATGSRAGISAPLQNGYYMVGRAKECQIRPKTRSVSRRHCVVFRENDAVKVLDLQSTSGTKINHQRIEPKQWCELKDGDELSCGKIMFRVSVKQENMSPASAKNDEGSKAVPVGSALSASERQSYNGSVSEQVTTNGEMVSGEAWQTFDVAEFLGTQDQADQEARYEKIRQSHASAVMDGTEFDTYEFDSDQSDESDLDEDFGAQANRTQSTRSEAAATKAPDPETAKSATSLGPRVAATSDRHKEKSEARNPKERTPSASGGWSWHWFSGFSGDIDRIKLFAAILLALAVLGLVATQVFEFTSGPPVRVIEDLD